MMPLLSELCPLFTETEEGRIHKKDKRTIFI